jgi:hypothetical protein
MVWASEFPAQEVDEYRENGVKGKVRGEGLNRKRTHDIMAEGTRETVKYRTCSSIDQREVYK